MFLYLYMLCTFGKPTTLLGNTQYFVMIGAEIEKSVFAQNAKANMNLWISIIPPMQSHDSIFGPIDR